MRIGIGESDSGRTAMQGYQRILELFDAWDERDVAIPFSELVESLRRLDLEEPTGPVLVFADPKWR